MPNYSETWFQNRDNRIIYNKTRYIQLTLEKLLRCIKGDELFAEQEIRYMISNILQDALYLEEHAINTYNNYDADTKKYVDDYYNKNLKLNQNSTGMQIPQHIIDDFNTKQNEIQEDIRDKTDERLNLQDKFVK